MSDAIAGIGLGIIFAGILFNVFPLIILGVIVLFGLLII